ncbi:MAG: efflux RND transporter periplasmic adaptor subunit [Phycisphaerales bacterium]|nr:efflux RND transporter periplasmic adaptor subunit [Phycisphaerales bacterium]
MTVVGRVTTLVLSPLPMRTYLNIAAAVLAVAVIGLVIGGGAIFEMLPGMGAREEKLGVRTATVKAGTLTETITAPGVVEPISQVEISAQVNARVMAIPFREGERVRKGDLLIQLDDRNLRAAKESATARRDGDAARLEAERARIAGPRQTVEIARRNMERQKRLFESGDVPRTNFEDAEVRVRELEATIAAAERSIASLESALAASSAEIERVEQELSFAKIDAPIDGFVTQLNAEVGELVVVGTMNQQGTVIMTVADLDKMRMLAQVAEADIAKVKVGQPCDIRINAYKDQVFKGVVTDVALQRTATSLGGGGSSASAATQGGGTFKVTVSIDSGGTQILSGLAGNVDITIAEHRGLVLPSQAIVERRTEDLPEAAFESGLADKSRRVTAVVFIDDGGKAIMAPVRTGPSSMTQTIVEAGLEANQTVVTGPYKALERMMQGDPIVVDSAAGPPGKPGGAPGQKPEGASPGSKPAAATAERAGSVDAKAGASERRPS